MNKGVLLCSLSVALLSTPVVVRADANPDFDEDAKPILRAQPGLINYVRSHFEVKDTGKARYPGDDDHRPSPPYIFRARPIGSEGPFNIRLLIEPGPPGHILCVVPPNNRAPQEPAPSEAPQQPSGYAQEPSGQDQQPEQGAAPSPYQPQEAQRPYQSPTLSQGDIKPLPPEASASQSSPAPQPAPEPPQQSAPASPSEPTADTPSGPIVPNSSTGSANPQQNLAPPPDPAPAGQ